MNAVAGQEQDIASDPFGPDAEQPSPFHGLWRLLLLPTLAGVMFFSGVFWFRHQIAAGGGAPEKNTFVEVSLLPRPDPVIPDAPALQAAALSVPNPASGPMATPATISSEDLTALPTDASAEAEPIVPSATQPSSTSATSDRATLEFSNTLLRHIAKFQRYPKAAERQRLQGTVHAIFSVSRDGKVLGAWIKTSSGQAVLDQAAIDTIRRAQPMPSIPPALPGEMKIEVALGFDPS